MSPAVSVSAPVRASVDVRAVPLPNGEVVRRHVDLAGRRRLDELPDGSWLRYGYDADGQFVEAAAARQVDVPAHDLAIGQRHRPDVNRRSH